VASKGTGKEKLTALLEKTETKALSAIADTKSSATLDELKREYLGKKSVLKQVNESLKDLATEERPEVGRAISSYREKIAAAIAEKEEKLQKSGGEPSDIVDLTLPPRNQPRGHYHLITQVERELVDIFVGLGYQVAEGPEVDTDWYNFEALNFPPGHPARDMQDTLYVNRGNGTDAVLRTHTSPVQVRTMEKQKPPVYVVVPGRVFRQETLDARHSPVFHQLEGLAVDESITMGDMFGTIKTFLSAFFGRDVRTRFLPSFFPFTEPSAEFAASCVFCDGVGCNVCSKTGWIEVGGCGMVDPNVFLAVGYDPEVVSGFAFGFGLERMAMLRHGIGTIASFYQNDVRVLQQF
jgi:phenylalanyl-tRNA synthetase alpha chain